jgi:ubiquinone/menaquinone biosynthesis C-methylase UbiE
VDKTPKNFMSGNWEDLAKWWDEKQGDDGDLWHRTLIDPTVLRILGDTSRKDVLDLGCGNGYFSRRLARLGAHVTGIDSSSQIIEICREQEMHNPLGIAYHVTDASNLSMLQDSSFDIILANMTLDDIESAEGAIRECSRVLRERGRLVGSISHPCFDMGKHSGWQIEKVGLVDSVWRKVDLNYRRVFEDTFEWRLSENEHVETRWYHRPLSWYIRALHEAGFVITALEEPEPNEEFLKNTNEPWIESIPVHCVLEACKLQA